MTATAATPIAADHSHYEGLKGKILNFLGAGIDPSRVASAVGCDPSYITQLLSDEAFANAVSDKQLSQLQEATDRDARLNGIEDSIIARTEQLVKSPLAFTKPMDSIRALAMVNNLKRRGAGDNLATTQRSITVNLMLPNVVTNKFTVDMNNQVIKAGDQTLVTIASGSVEGLAKQLVVLDKSSLEENYNEYTVDDIR